jgi:uncharacterized lipoprotein YbaY
MSSCRMPRVVWAGLVCVSVLQTAATAFAQFSNDPSWQQGNRWRLGVDIQNTTTGVVVSQVLPGGAAAAGGINAGDRILAVAGHQVGYVDGALVDIGDEVNQHVTPDGKITLLVFTARGQLQAGTLTMTSSGGVIQGTVQFQGRMPQLSSQAVLNVRMLDATYNQWSGNAVAQTFVPRPDRNPSFFQLAYDPTKIYSNHRYAVIGEVVDSGRIVSRSERPVECSISSGKVTLVMTSTAAPPVAGDSGRPPGWNTVALPYEQVTQWYQTYLGRQPTEQELFVWSNHLNRGQPASDIQAYLLGSSEYYERYQNNPNLYVQGVYRSVNGNDPTPQQLQTWRKSYDDANGVRSQFVQQVVVPPGNR